jgi:hypothetical protein
MALEHARLFVYRAQVYDKAGTGAQHEAIAGDTHLRGGRGFGVQHTNDNVRNANG